MHIQRPQREAPSGRRKLGGSWVQGVTEMLEDIGLKASTVLALFLGNSGRPALGGGQRELGCGGGTGLRYRCGRQGALGLPEGWQGGGCRARRGRGMLCK